MSRKKFPLSLSCSAFSLVAVAPLWTFLGHHGYPFYRPEVLLCLIGLAALASIAAFLARAAGRYVEILFLTGFLLLFVDMQFNVFHTYGPKGLIFSIVAFIVASLLIQKHGFTVIITIFSVLLIADLFLPPGARPQKTVDAKRMGSSRGKFPMILHIILDEHIGIEGFPTDIQGGETTKDKAKQLYLTNGFRLFGGAYSRYYNSPDSIGNLLNFTTIPNNYHYFGGRFVEGDSMTHNRYFEVLEEQGFEIYVYQSDYIDFCKTKSGFRSSGCVTYALETPKALESADLSAVEKSKMFIGMLLRRSYLLERWSNSWEIGRVSAIPALNLLTRVKNDLREGGRGKMFFAHVVLPHYPFAYNSNCSLHPKVSEWLEESPRGQPRPRNSKASREVRYKLYFQQLECTNRKIQEIFDELKKLHLLDSAMIIVHGDHGSRIDFYPPFLGQKENLKKSDYADGFSTLFAVRTPTFEAQYFSENAPLEKLFLLGIKNNPVPKKKDWAGPPEIFLMAAKPALSPLPFFGPAR